MESEHSDSAVETILPNGVNGINHEKDPTLDDLDDADDGDLFGDGPEAEESGYTVACHR